MKEKEIDYSNKGMEHQYSIIYRNKDGHEVQAITMSAADLKELKKQGYKPVQNRRQRRKQNSLARDALSWGEKTQRPKGWRDKEKKRKKIAKESRRRNRA